MLVKNIYRIIVDIRSKTYSFFLPRTTLVILYSNNRMLWFQIPTLVQIVIIPQHVHLVLMPSGLCPLHSLHHVLVRLLVGWGHLGAILMTLTDSSNICLVRFVIPSSCLATVGSWEVGIMIVGLVYNGASIVLEGWAFVTSCWFWFSYGKHFHMWKCGSIRKELSV